MDTSPQMTSLQEMARLLGFSLEEARSWTRELEDLEPVARDGRGARRLSEAQVARTAAARVIALFHGCSRREALERVRRVEATAALLASLEPAREALGLPALETRVARLEAITGEGTGA